MITRILLAEILRFAENFGSLRGVGDSKVLFFYKKNKTLTKQKNGVLANRVSTGSTTVCEVLKKIL